MLFLSLLAGCGRPASPRPSPSIQEHPVEKVAEGDSCAVGSDSTPLPRRLVVAVTDPIRRSGPTSASNRTERMINRQLYEPLIRLSCTGRVIPALAESWSSADSGRIWTFTIRRGARFWDGTPVLAFHVITSWAGHSTDDVSVPWAGIEHAKVVDDRRVVVVLAQTATDIPHFFGDPRLVISLAGRVISSTRVMGTGPYRVSYEDSSEIVLDAWDSGIERAGSLPRSLEVRPATGTAARDMLDQGVDLLFTDDRSLLEYATQRGQYTVTPLPWDRRYVLFVPSTGVTDPPSQAPTGGFLDAVAREAVEVEARVGPDAGQWKADRCGVGSGSEPDPRRQPRRVVYSSTDETARALAHRLVTFAGAPGQGGDWLLAAFHQPASARSFPFAIGLEPLAWPPAVQRGDEIAYIFDLPAHSYSACGPPNRTEGSFLPLIETRANVAARGGIGGLATDWDGTPFFAVRP